MVWARRFWLRLQTLFRREGVSQRLDDEVQFHLEQQITENIAAGMNPQEARYAAMRTFGNPTITKEQARDTWGWIWLEQIGQDFRYGIRMLSRNPGFTLVAVLSLALGIGVNTTVFSAVNTVLLRPLAYPDADRLVLVQYRSLHAGSGRFELTPAAYLELRRTNKCFEGIAAFTASDFNLIGIGEPERLSGQMISPSLFSVLKVSSQIGRGFTAEDEKDGAPRVAILSYGLWQRRYGGLESVIGQTITLDDESFEVVGVAPRGFDFPEKGTDIWVPKVFAASELHDMNSYYLRVTARLKTGVPFDQAQSELNTFAHNWAQSYPENGDLALTLTPLRDAVVQDFQQALVVLQVAVLDWCCLSVASMWPTCCWPDRPYVKRR